MRKYRCKTILLYIYKLKRNMSIESSFGKTGLRSRQTYDTMTHIHTDARKRTRTNTQTRTHGRTQSPPAYQPSHSILIHPNSCYRDQKGTSHQRRRSDGYDMQRLGNMSRGWRERTARERGTGVGGSAGSVFLWAW